MIIDYRSANERAIAVRYSVYDVETGECLDRSDPYFYADDEAGYLLRHRLDEKGCKYVWDSRDHRRLTGTFRSRGSDSSEFQEVAWERVDRAIVIRPRGQTA